MEAGEKVKKSSNYKIGEAAVAEGEEEREAERERELK